MTQESSKDFFIRNNKPDRAWAEWIVWQLESNGYTTILQAWGFLPGSNFVLDMNQAIQQASRTIALLSPDYLTSSFTPSESTGAFAQDPTGEHGKRNKYLEVPLNATARATLLAYDASLQKPQSSTTPLFLSEKRHTQLTERGLGYLIKKYVERARVSNVNPHDLRYRFGYHMAASVPLHRLAELMGHDSLDTAIMYVQATKQDLQQAVETIVWT